MLSQTVLVAYFLLGFGALLAQTVLLREFMFVSYGNELCVGALLSAWLFWIAVGAEVGAWRASRVRYPREAFCWWLLIAALSLPAEVAFLRFARGFLNVPEGEYVPLLISALFGGIALAPFSLAIGYTFPLGLRLWSEETDNTSAVGWLWAAEAWGSLAGGIVFTFLLVEHLRPFHCAVLVMVCCLAAWGMVKWKSKDGIRLWVAWFQWCVAIIALSLILFCGYIENVTAQARWTSLGTYSKLTQSVDSRYQNISVSRRNEQYNLFLNGRYSTCFPDDYDPAVTAKMAQAQLQHDDSILVIGGGIEGMIRHLLSSQIRRLDYVELDPAIITTVRPYLKKQDSDVLKDGRVQILLVDGRRYVKTVRAAYDLVFVNLPDPSTAMLNRYYTVEFFAEVSRALKPEGVFVFSLTGSQVYLGTELADYVASVYYSLKSVFPYVLVCPEERSFFYATNKAGLLSGDPDILIQRRAKYDRSSDIVSSVIYRSYFLPERFELFKKRLEGLSHVPLNRDLHPTAYLRYMIFTERLSNFRLSDWLMERKSNAGHLPPFAWLLGALARVSKWCEGAISPLTSTVRTVNVAHVYGLLGGIILLGLTLHNTMSLHRRRRNTLLSVALTVGFTGITLEIVLLLAFQATYGYLYHAIGLLVAVFMFGLAVGSGVAARWIKGQILRQRSLVLLLISVVVCAATLPVVIRWVSALPLIGWVIFGLMIVWSGFLTGMILPATAALMRHNGVEITRATGQVSRADHLGACFGALLCVTLLVPVWGMVHTCLLVAALNVAALIWLLAAWGRRYGEK